MKSIVAMLIICWAPQNDGTLKEVWRIEEAVTLDHCLTMNRIFSGGGTAAAITVRCGGFPGREDDRWPTPM